MKPNPHVTPRPRDQSEPEGRLDTYGGGSDKSDRESTGSGSPLQKEAWHWMKGLYKAMVDCVPLPTRVTLERITKD